MISAMYLRIATFVVLGAGLLTVLVGVFRGGGVIWIAYALLIVASLLALWVKWGRSGWGWELRRARRR